jgi:hypothetical protein
VSPSGAVSGRYGRSPGGMGGSGTGSTARPASTRQAHTLNSGILEIGSRASTVSALAAIGPAQWYGTNTVSGRMASVTSAG